MQRTLRAQGWAPDPPGRDARARRSWSLSPPPPHRPQCEADRSIHLHSKTGQYPDHFDDNRASGCVIRRARSADPGIEVSAHHHDFIPLPAARNLSNYTETVEGGRAGRNVKVDLHQYRDIALEQSGKPIVMF